MLSVKAALGIIALIIALGLLMLLVYLGVVTPYNIHSFFIQTQMYNIKQYVVSLLYPLNTLIR